MNRIERGPRYWRALEERAGSEPAAAEAPAPSPADERPVDRRDFLRLAGFTVGAAALAGCSPGVERHVLPYLVGSEEAVPGRAYWYATVCGGCAAGCGALARCRDGRPIKLEGIPDHPLSRGGLCAIGQAGVLALYDAKRLRRPSRGSAAAEWAEIDGEIAGMLDSLRGSGGRVRFLTDSTTGPTERRQIAAFLARFADGRHVIYDPISSSAVADAHARTHGARVVPRYRLDRADALVAFAADFLGTWISPVEHAAAYAAGRDLTATAGRFLGHTHFESRLSLTGSNADRRIVVPPHGMRLTVAHLVTELARRLGAAPPWRALPACPVDADGLQHAIEELAAAPRGRALVLSGENDLAAQVLVNYANHLLGAYGTGATESTIELTAASSRTGDDAALRALIAELESGAVDALFVRGVNPVYDLPDGPRLAAALERVGLVVSFADPADETAAHARFVCPEPHFLEAWGDAEPAAGVVALRQPTVRTIGDSRPLLESLAAWSGAAASAHDQLREAWLAQVYPRRLSEIPFDTFWNRALHEGFAAVRVAETGPRVAPDAFDPAALATLDFPGATDGPELRIVLHASASALDGRHAHNAWLHELPDPIAKTVWDNVVAIAPETAAGLGVATGDVVRLEPPDAEGGAIELPALVQPGLHRSTLAVGLGYGRQGTERFAQVGPQWWEGRSGVGPNGRVGTNAAPLLAWDGDRLVYSGRAVRLTKTGVRRELALTQTHHSLHVPPHLARRGYEVRPIVQEATLVAWRDDPHAGAHAHHELPTLWEDHAKGPHHWGMAIDLTACTGCSACVIACQAENNIPVVGQDEVRRAREMHWMRIDRYYSGDGDGLDVVYMPMLCQHCDNAPCETVCPVQATVQSAEGLNQQVYNRCVGTRYCANNCPYKVRRFNWFDYPREEPLQNLALNPEVTVRSRGVMEKCSLCVQRIQDAKAEARHAGRPLHDGDIVPACAQSCPAQAIVFGDMNDRASRVSRLKHDPRHYTVLGELGVRPTVGYLTRIRDRESV